ncbi:hypothetical protein IPL44_01425 [Candidatus Saccharibacteria bacterium]|jgi:hypothetical protein|nr:MAG: hypothetical protein IPL44_01425 [Candidatus Saccharibacteria bacterium]
MITINYYPDAELTITLYRTGGRGSTIFVNYLIYLAAVTGAVALTKKLSSAIIGVRNQ